MIYIITEDSCSGYEFWELVCNTFLEEGCFELLSGKGNLSLRREFDNVFEKCIDSQDSIILIFDNIANTSKFNPGNLIAECKQKCLDKNILFLYSDFYCFESIFLSYEEILNMTFDCKNAIVKDTIKYVNESINKGIGYWDSTDDRVDYFLNDSGIEAKNREHFEAELLSIGTRYINYGHFHIKKGSFGNGECWIKLCNDIQTRMNRFVRTKDCDVKCKYINKDVEIVEKLNDIFDKSILNKSKVINYIRQKEYYDKDL